ncbi:MAG: hypothetical protein ABII12_03440 [Planctomycetota bacterium]
MNGSPTTRYRKVKTISGKGAASDRFAEALRAVAIASDRRLFAAGDSVVKAFSDEGELLASWPTSRPGLSVGLAGDGRVFVGQVGQAQMLDSAGKELDTWRDAERLGAVTAIGFAGEFVLFADVKDRCIRRYDRSGKFINNIGKDNRMRGFLVPNGHLDFAVDEQAVIHAANPGKHRIERYTLDDKLLGHFGRFGGQDPAGFSGCCNPTNIALAPGDRIVVTEKAGPQVKIYDSGGKLLAVMGEKDFDPVCKNMDVAVDAQGHIYVVDTVRLHVCVFAPEAPAATTQPDDTGAGTPVKP